MKNIESSHNQNGQYAGLSIPWNRNRSVKSYNIDRRCCRIFTLYQYVYFTFILTANCCLVSMLTEDEESGSFQSLFALQMFNISCSYYKSASRVDTVLWAIVKRWKNSS